MPQRYQTQRFVRSVGLFQNALLWVQTSHRYKVQDIEGRRLLLILRHIDILGGTVYELS